LKEGSLCNLTGGGEGFSLSKETRKKISKALEGKPSWNKGKKMSKETKQKMSKATKRWWSRRAQGEGNDYPAPIQ